MLKEKIKCIQNYFQLKEMNEHLETSIRQNQYRGSEKPIQGCGEIIENEKIAQNKILSHYRSKINYVKLRMMKELMNKGKCLNTQIKQA